MTLQRCSGVGRSCQSALFLAVNHSFIHKTEPVRQFTEIQVKQ